MVAYMDITTYFVWVFLFVLTFYHNLFSKFLPGGTWFSLWEMVDPRIVSQQLCVSAAVGLALLGQECVHIGGMRPRLHWEGGTRLHFHQPVFKQRPVFLGTRITFFSSFQLRVTSKYFSYFWGWTFKKNWPLIFFFPEPEEFLLICKGSLEDDCNHGSTFRVCSVALPFLSSLTVTLLFSVLGMLCRASFALGSSLTHGDFIL